ncbi:MAG: right-handed parallel beta-helix repeat-containing protein [Verrucomicrobiales bacterium]|nr:right-handed parallel beta-helix repeat-containing protein [Verrucomicrobiales bacterium]
MMMKVFLPFIPVFFVMFSGTALAGRTLYVSTQGNDNFPGTEAKPFRTIQQACDEVGAGDTVLVKAGLYNEQIYVENGGNEKSGFVTIQSEEPGKAVVSAKGLNTKRDHNIFCIENKSYVRITGFELRDLQVNDGSGIRVEGAGSHYEFRNNKIHSILGKSAMGITIYGVNRTRPVSNLIIDGNEIYNCDAAPSEALTLNGNVTDFQVTNNYVHDIRGVGIDFIGGEKGIVKDQTKTARNGLCRGNRVERVRAPYGGGYGPGIYVDGGSNIVIEGNSVSECDLGIEVGAENPGVLVEKVWVVGNIVFKNDKAGIVIGGYNKARGRVTNCGIYNNLFHGNTNHERAEAEIWIQWAENNSFRNNIIIGRSAGRTKPLLYSENKNQANDLNYNLWYHADGKYSFVWSGREFDSFEAFRGRSGCAQNSIKGSPRLAEDGRHVLPGSPAIDAGDPAMAFPGNAVDIDGKPRVNNGRVDIGPVEA